MSRPLALWKVVPPASAPVAFEQVVNTADQHAALAYLLGNHLSESDEVDAYQAALLLGDALQRQAALLRLFMDTPDAAAGD